MLRSMSGMRRRNRLAIMVRMSRMTRITEATWRNGGPSLIMVTILKRLARIDSAGAPLH